MVKEAMSFPYSMNRIDETPDCVIVDLSLKTSSFTAIHSEEICICSFHEKHDIPAWCHLLGVNQVSNTVLDSSNRCAHLWYLH